MNAETHQRSQFECEFPSFQKGSFPKKAIFHLSLFGFSPTPVSAGWAIKLIVIASN